MKAALFALALVGCSDLRPGLMLDMKKVVWRSQLDPGRGVDFAESTPAPEVQSLTRAAGLPLPQQLEDLGLMVLGVAAGRGRALGGIAASLR